jgi:hypothetical protein
MTRFARKIPGLAEKVMQKTHHLGTLCIPCIGRAAGPFQANVAVVVVGDGLSQASPTWFA